MNVDEMTTRAEWVEIGKDISTRDASINGVRDGNKMTVAADSSTLHDNKNDGNM